MKALVVTEPGKVRFIDQARPSPGGGEVLLRVRTVGYCGTDLNTFRGRNPLVSYPRIPCHEIGAIVVEKGEDVPEEIRLGMEVTISPYTHCGTCTACRAKRPNCCRANQTLGAQRDGSLTEYVLALWRDVFWSPRLSLRELALVEPLSVGFHAVGRARITADDTVAVLGCGAIGLAVIAGASARKARVIAVDIEDHKLIIAQKAGAAELINSRRELLHDRLSSLTDGDGPEVIIEAIGLPETFQLAVSEVAHAGRIVYIGYAKSHVEYDTKQFLLKELDIFGSRNALPQDFQASIEWLESGCFPTNDVVTRTFPFENAGTAFQAWSESPQSFTKIHVEMEES